MSQLVGGKCFPLVSGGSGGSGGASGGPITELVGTEEAPIIVHELEEGFYLVSGKFKWNNSYTYTTNFIKPVLLKMGPSSTGTRWAFLEYACRSGTDIDGSITTSVIVQIPANESLYNSHITEYNIEKYAKIKNKGNGTGEALTIGMRTKCEPTSDNDPIQKWYVDNTIKQNLSVIKLENPIENADNTHINKFILNTDTSDNNLYFCRQLYLVTDTPIELNVRYENIVFNRDIINKTGLILNKKVVAFTGVFIKGTTSTTAANLIFTFDENGVITRITEGLNGSVFYENNVWNFDLFNPENYGCEGIIITSINDEVFTNNYLSYICTRLTTEEIKVMKVPLQEVTE